MKSLPAVAFRRATVDDGAVMATFGERAFREAFGPDNDSEDMAAYCGVAYQPERIRRELADAARHTVLCELSGTLVGYAQLLREPAPPCVRGPAPLELLRFYVDRPLHGLGVAQLLMREAIAAALELQAGTLYLGVWEHNPRALAFYARQGFRDVGSRPFVLGRSHQTDRIMVREL
jgi:GNAT superfamily N-acetyltransferase